MKNNNRELIAIDFAMPWWSPIAHQKIKVGAIFLTDIGCNIFSTLLPVIMSSFFALKRLDYICYLFAAWAGVYCVQYIIRSSYSLIQSNIIHSVHAAAHAWFLQIDPIYHTRRASGSVAGKIDRAARAYEFLLDSCFYELIPIFIGLGTVIAYSLIYNLVLGVALAIVLSLLAYAIMFISYKIIQPLEKEWMKIDDKVRGISIENLTQINLIRASFASNEIAKKLKSLDSTIMQKESYLLVTLLRMYLCIKLIYLCIFLSVALYLLRDIIAGNLTEAAGIGFLSMYIQGTRDLLRLDRPVKQIIKSITNINDLRFYTKNFGKQTYPVLQEDACHFEPKSDCKENQSLVLDVQNLYFDYQSQAKIFDNHRLTLQAKCTEPIKLYGIIGPSGIGKSTLLSILGGQLNPSGGQVLVAGVDIYKVDDNIRRKIIALQGQVATNFRGTLEYNLLFGLPEKVEAYTHEHLKEILKKVGIWSFFAAKDGLNTFIGEGGLTLSGGQRQRLNFANLYLRAHYFKPALILIDEPTSSLDEVSEQAITDMILELSVHAVTIVIAHRLKTLSKALGILDFSLVPQSKEMVFAPHSELLNSSEYYKNLIHGKIPLEE